MKRPRCDHVESIGERGADMALSVPRTLPAETSLPIIQLLRRAIPRIGPRSRNNVGLAAVERPRAIVRASDHEFDAEGRERAGI